MGGSIQIPAWITDETHYAATLFAFIKTGLFLIFFSITRPHKRQDGFMSSLSSTAGQVASVILFSHEITSVVMFGSLSHITIAGAISHSAAAKQAHVYLSLA